MAIAPSIFVTFPHSMISNDAVAHDIKEAGANILIDSYKIEMPALLGFLRSIRFNYIYSLSGNILDAENIHSILPQLYTLFVLSGCFPRSVSYVPVFSNDNERIVKALEIIKEYFRLQGNNKIEFAILPMLEEPVVTDNKFICLQFSQLDTFNDTDLEKYNNLSPEWILLAPRRTQSVSNDLQYAETAIGNNKYLKEFARQTIQKISNNWLLYENDLWKKRAALYHSFIGLSKKVGETQYYDILKWYNDEYEVLPLWYKRIGHVIKIITGKKKLRRK